MTESEFSTQLKRLRDVHPNVYGPKEKAISLWNLVKDLPLVWFKPHVDNMVSLSSFQLDKFDIYSLVQAEKRAQNNKNRADLIIKSLNKTDGMISEQGFNQVLKGYNATSIWDAIQKGKNVSENK